MSTCKIKDCKKKLSKKHGKICPMHRMRYHRYGDYDYVSPNWKNFKKGTPCLTKNGYVRININGKRVLQHRWIMEQYLGRRLCDDEIVRHKDGVRSNNDIKNLFIVKITKSE